MDMVMSRLGLWAVLAGAAIPMHDATASEVRPGSLLVYYGFPSSINGTFTVPLAAAEFGMYDHVVLGNGLQDGPGDPLPHPDHQNTRDIIAHPATANTRFYGYVDVGVITQNLSQAEIMRRVDSWADMGADGIFFDDFGYDFGVTRLRQNAAVDYVHGLGLPAVANGFFPDDVFGNDVHANNPDGLPSMLDASGYYLSESHQIIRGCVQSQGAWMTKAMSVLAFQESIGFKVFSVTTNNSENGYAQEQFFYSWYSAAMFGHEATGWGEHLFSASGVANSQAPFRTRPTGDFGSAFIGGVVTSGSAFTRTTDTGTIFVNPATRQVGFVTPLSNDADDDGVLDPFDVCGATPNGTPVDAQGRPIGDTDLDCDVDLHDFGRLQDSFTGVLK
jgi:hypothetical protein